MTNMVDGIGTTKYTYSAAGQLLTEDGPFASDTVTNTYSNRLRVGLSLQQPTGVWTNGFGYDGIKRLISVASPAGNFSYYYLAGVGTPPTRQPMFVYFPNTCYITNDYDADARLTSTRLEINASTILDSYAYTYNPANQRTNLARAGGSAVAYSYDKIGQLTVADSSVNSEDRGYAYDSASNLNRRTNFFSGSPGGTENFTNDSRNELVGHQTFAGAETNEFDANGNLTLRYDAGSGNLLFTYEYDDENRLTLLQYNDYDTPYYQLHQLVYDGLGRLREVVESLWDGADWTPFNDTVYIYDGWRVIQERDNSNTPTVSYTRGNDLSHTLEGAGGIGGLLARSAGYSSGTWTSHAYYFADGNGNIVYMTDGSRAMVAQYRYDPFGQAISESGTLATDNSYRFSSKELLGKNLDGYGAAYYYGYRFYDPYLQRWINRDPIHEFGFLKAKRRKSGWHPIQELNLYAFVRGQVAGKIDPFGLKDAGPLGGSCCNFSGHDEWWLDEGTWKPLPPNECTGLFDDCDGLTCQGGFYWVGNLEGQACNPPGHCPDNNPSMLPPGPGSGIHGPPPSRRWTPSNPGPDSRPPGPYPGWTGPYRGAPTADPPPGYTWE